MKFKRILILVAMDSELSCSMEKFPLEKKQVTSLGIEIYAHESDKKSIFLAKTGVGPINAGAVTALLSNELKPDLVLLLGLGGAIDRRLVPGDVCIGTHVIQHDAVCSYDDRLEQMASGELHLSLDPKDRPDIKLLTNSFINERISLYLKNKGYNIFTGHILSGSEFIGSIVRKELMSERFKNAVLIEMEACGAGLICKRLDIPFSVIKTVADTLSAAPDKEYKDFLDSNAQKCADVFDFVREL